jgi:leucyl aminopeptidase (aminopeptidase T)
MYAFTNITVLPELNKAAAIAINDSLKVELNEQVLIITNPLPDVASIAVALYEAAVTAGGKPVLIFQPEKSQLSFAEPAVIAAFSAKPEVIISLSAEKLGKDAYGATHPYRYNNIDYDHIYHALMYGARVSRSFWSPGTTVDSFCRTVPIDYAVLKQRCAAIKSVLDDAVEVHITAPGGTDLRCGLRARYAKTDDGDFGSAGTGGNLPAGETFISPENNTASGIIVFDGSISLYNNDILIRKPIRCTVNHGFVTDIDGGDEASALLQTITLAEENAHSFERDGNLPAGAGERYACNARNIGEIGIGLNPAAQITGNMLEDEKAFRTCHFAIGHNYDEDAPSLIHLDGLVKEPTIIAIAKDGTETVIEQDGELRLLSAI